MDIVHMKGVKMHPLEQYAQTHSSIPDIQILATELESDEFAGAWAPVRSSRTQAQFLATLARAIDARRIVEVGTFTGYTTLALSLACPEALIQTFDSSPTFIKFARERWDRAYSANIRAYIGDAKVLLPEMTPSEVDFAFIDADKESYLEYYEVLVPKMRPNGLLVIDDTLWFGEVLNPQSPMCEGIRKLNNVVASDARVEATMLTYRNGLTICRKRGN